MQEIQRAKYDIDQFLKSDEEQKKERVKNTISLDNSILGICKFKTYGFTLFFISEEISNGKIKRFVRSA
jgi:hypothetical protein